MDAFWEECDKKVIDVLIKKLESDLSIMDEALPTCSQRIKNTVKIMTSTKLASISNKGG